MKTVVDDFVGLAHDSAIHYIKQCHLADRETTQLDYDQHFRRKLVEFVARECAAIAWFDEQYRLGDGTPVSKLIKEKFGVSE